MFNKFGKQIFCNKAFTLSEILIALGVIGLAAAMTIPSLVTKINDKIRAHQKEVMLTRLAEGFNLFSSQENGLNVPYSNTKEFVQGLSKHMKIISICGPENLEACFPFKKISYEDNGELKEVDVSSLTKPEKIGLSADGFLDPAGFVMANGTVVLMSWNNNCGALKDSKGIAYVDPDKALSRKNMPLGVCIDGLYSVKSRNDTARFNKDIFSIYAATLGDTSSDYYHHHDYSHYSHISLDMLYHCGINPNKYFNTPNGKMCQEAFNTYCGNTYWGHEHESVCWNIEKNYSNYYHNYQHH